MKKIKLLIKVLVLICILILVIDLIVFIHMKKESNRVHFDTINSFEEVDNGYIAVGSYSNKSDKEEAKITKYDKKLNKVWEKYLNKKYSSSYFNVKQDKENYIAVGNYEAKREEHDNNIRSAIISKYDKDGNILKEKKFQVLGNSKFTNLLVVDDGYIVIGQSIYENMVLGNSDKGGGYIIKYDKDLNIVWKSNYGGSKSGIYNDLVIMDDYIYAVGKDGANAGMISKYSLDGKMIKTVSYSDTDTFGFTGVTVFDSTLYVVGAKKISDTDNSALIVQYDNELNIVNEKDYNSVGKDRFNNIINDNDNLVVVGQSAIYNKKQDEIVSYNGIYALIKHNLEQKKLKEYKKYQFNYFTDVKRISDKYLVSSYHNIKDGYKSKFITFELGD